VKGLAQLKHGNGGGHSHHWPSNVKPGSVKRGCRKRRVESTKEGLEKGKNKKPSNSRASLEALKFHPFRTISPGQASRSLKKRKGRTGYVNHASKGEGSKPKKEHEVPRDRSPGRALDRDQLKQRIQGKRFGEMSPGPYYVPITSISVPSVKDEWPRLGLVLEDWETLRKCVLNQRASPLRSSTKKNEVGALLNVVQMTQKRK